MEEGMPVCYCVPDFHGERCELQYDECQLGPRCMNGGVCIDGVDDFTCSCPPNLTGRLCECLMIDDDDMDCNYTAPSTTESYTSTIGGGVVDDYTTTDAETTFTVPITPVTTAAGSGSTSGGSVPKLTTQQSAEGDFRTTTRSRLSTTSFQTPGNTNTPTFRPHPADNELHHDTFSGTDATSVYTDETFVDGGGETTPYATRFATRPTPAQGTFTTYEPTVPVPTDAPEHITHFFTEFPRYTTTSATDTSYVTTPILTTTSIGGAGATETTTIGHTTVTSDRQDDPTTTIEPQHLGDHTTVITEPTTVITSTSHSIDAITTTPLTTSSITTSSPPGWQHPIPGTTTSAPSQSSNNATVDCIRHPCENGGTCSSSRVSKN